MILGMPLAMAAFLAGLFTWAMTASGAAVVFFINNVGRRTTAVLSGLAAGIMMSASFWSLLLPAKEMCEQEGRSPLPALGAGFLCGGFFIVLSGLFFERLDKSGMGFHPGSEMKTRSALIVLAITMHNMPEGLAMGVALGAAASRPELLPAALVLVLGIGMQDIPEGSAVALPLRRDGHSRLKCFFIGQLSAVVEPAAAVAGALIAVSGILPFALAFAAGAMVFVVAQELVPEAVSAPKIGVCALMAGFTLMTMLDVAF